MLVSDTSPIAFRSDFSVELVERGADTTLRLRPARRVAITPTSATVTLTDPNGVVVVDAADADCTAGQAAYTVLGADTANLVLGERWTVTWSVELPGESVARALRLEAALVRARLYPVISDADLFRRCSSLDPAGSAPITAIDDFTNFLDDAWALVQEQLLAKGDRPWLVLSPAALRETHLTMTLALVFDDLATRLNPAYAETAQGYRKQSAAAFRDVRFVYDPKDQGTAGCAAAGRTGPNRSIWLGGRMP